MKREHEKINESTRYVILSLILLAGVFLAPYAWRSLRPIIIDPGAYYLWSIKRLLSVFPQSVFWVFIIGSLGLISVIILLRYLNPKEVKQEKIVNQKGQVGSLADVILRSKKSHYNKWLIANRFANTTIDTLNLNSGETDDYNHVFSNMNWEPPEEVKEYIKAGLDNSKMRFQRQKGLFKNKDTSPLDLDINTIIDYIESEMESS